MLKAVLNTLNYQRALPKLAVLVTLSMLTGILAGLLAVGLFYAAYVALLRHGLDADAAFFVIGVGVAAAMTLSAIITAGYIKKLRQVLQPFSPISSGANDIAGAFMDGLFAPSSRKGVR